MAEEPEVAEEPAVETPHRHHPVRTILKWVAIALGVVVLLVACLFGFLQTDSGRRFVAHQIEALEFKNGMKIGIGRLNGNLFGSLTVDRLTVSDPQGEFLAIPHAKLDWRPIAYLFGHVDVRSLTAQTVTLERVPHLKPSEQKGPLLPDIDIDVGKLQVDRFVALPAVTGKRRVLSFGGTAHIADGARSLTSRRRPSRSRAKPPAATGWSPRSTPSPTRTGWRWTSRSTPRRTG